MSGTVPEAVTGNVGILFKLALGADPAVAALELNVSCPNVDTGCISIGTDPSETRALLERCRAETDRPSFIQLRTVIAFPAPKAMNTGKAHGSALGDDEVRAVKEILGFDPARTFEVADEVLAHARKVVERGRTAHEEWTALYDSWAAREPERKELLERMLGRELPVGWEKALPSWEVGDKAVATRKASGEILKALADVLPDARLVETPGNHMSAVVKRELGDAIAAFLA